MSRTTSPLEALRRFIEGGGFPTFALSLLLFYELLLVAMLLAPAGPSGFAAFAEEFRVWCLGYDPATGRTDWTWAIAMIAPQVMVGALVVLLWWEPLRALLERPRAMLPYATAAAVLVAGAAAGFVLLREEASRGELPFPAEALRTAHPAPALALTNQRGEPVELTALRGKVVMLTAMYASCPHTCPLILAQSKRAIAELTPEEQAQLRVVAVTLDPAHDSREVLAELAEIQGMPAPLYNLVTGEIGDVERILDEMGVSRRRNPETGVIDHANLFVLLDREGKVAYRLGLGEHQERWLTSALRVLLRESNPTG